jgi:hypothetical protein
LESLAERSEEDRHALPTIQELCPHLEAAGHVGLRRNQATETFVDCDGS